MSRRAIDLTGCQSGRLTVISRAENSIRGQARWNCVCACGNKRIVASASLVKKTTKSCGCLMREIVSKLNRTHGMRKTPIYGAWFSMKHRCLNPNNPFYHHYGGRGISVCPRWLENFENFLEDMGDRPEGMSLDRIDVNGNYEPGNCRWATWKEQQNNRRDNRFIEFNRKTQSLAAWGRELGIHEDTLRWRLKTGWSVEKAFTTPADKKHASSRAPQLRRADSRAANNPE
jgi:hypothetical protein